MTEFKRLLILVDAEQGTGQAAIHRALSLADKDLTQIILLLQTYVPSEDLASVLSEEQRHVLQRHAMEKAEGHLSLLANKLRCQGHNVATHIGWHKHAYEAVIAAVTEEKADLVFAATKKHTRLERLVVTPEERQLLRFCPCPVWLVKDAEREGPVLAAIDAGSTDTEHQALNRLVASTARSVARGLGARWQSFTAFPGVPIMYPANVSLDIPVFERDSVDRLRKAAFELGEPLGLVEADIHVEQGAPAEVLCEQAEKLGASVLVVGTVARTGFNAFLIGNTAELIIDRSACDVLAVKPEGFVSPLRAGQ